MNAHTEAQLNRIGETIRQLAGDLDTACDAVRESADENLSLSSVPAAMQKAYFALLVLANLLRGKTVYQAFGAPGDWGYHTSIGEALALAYSLRVGDERVFEPSPQVGAVGQQEQSA